MSHFYLTVLGSCATADSFRTDGWPTFVDAGLRVFDYIGRTDFVSLESAGLGPDEVRQSTQPVHSDWGLAMARGEVDKSHAPRLLRGAKTNQVLLFDVVTSFIFRELQLADGRRFLSSWELERYFRIGPRSYSRWLWETPYEVHRDAAVAFLSRLRERRPDLQIGFHVAPICLNDGVRFKVHTLNARVPYYYAFCERLARDLEAQVPRLEVLQAPRATWGADPAHPYRRYPFHYRLAYYSAFRRQVKRWLGLPDEATLAAPADPSAAPV